MKQLTSCLALALSLALLPSPGRASLFFSEYVEGSSYNKALEIFNPTTETLNLADYDINIYYNGGSDPTTYSLEETWLSPGTVAVIAHTSAVDALKSKADFLLGMSFNGDDAISLIDSDNNNCDVIGQIGHDPGSLWGDEAKGTQDMTLFRNPEILTGDPDGSDPFLLTEWTALPLNDFSGLGSHEVNAVPLPPAVLLLGTGLLGVLGVGRVWEKAFFS